MLSASVSHPLKKSEFTNNRRREINCQPWTVQKLAQEDNSKVRYLRARFFELFLWKPKLSGQWSLKSVQRNREVTRQNIYRARAFLLVDRQFYIPRTFAPEDILPNCAIHFIKLVYSPMIIIRRCSGGYEKTSRRTVDRGMKRAQHHVEPSSQSVHEDFNS